MGSEVKHTPGPWAFSHPYGEVQGGCDGRVVCEVDRLFGATITVRGPKAEMKTVEDHDYEATANARLIAAAPQMLAALKRIVFNWDGEPEDMDEAREAISLATGATP